MKNKTNLLLILILVAGLSLLIYPSFSDYWNSFTQSQVIVDYTKQIDNLDEEKYDRILSEARAYNEKLIGTLEHLRDLGNTVIVVEHDTDTLGSIDG